MSKSICVEDIWKEYRINSHHSKNQSAREVMNNVVQAPFRLAGNLVQGKIPRFPERKQNFWALKGISFDVEPGEVVGIIGRNGAGKSTLFRVISRITAPTKGNIHIWGQVATLLEVGTGFHPSLTGRENIFLAGSIFGMRQSEVRRKFDAIVEYSEVEKFLDTPVRRYSSGMYVRLAFAVMAHLNPDILLIDEILAVGDVNFQNKCLATIRDGVRDGTRTVLFVSHNLQLVRNICSRVIHIEQGEVMMDAPTAAGLTAYNRFLQKPKDLSQDGLVNRHVRSSGAVQIGAFTAKREGDGECWRFRHGDTVKFDLGLEVLKPVQSLATRLTVRSAVTGEVVTTTFDVLSKDKAKVGETLSAELRLPDISLRPGDYSLTVEITDADRTKVFDVIDHNVGLPWLSIDISEEHPFASEGYVSIPSQVTLQCAVRARVTEIG